MPGALKTPSPRINRPPLHLLFQNQRPATMAASASATRPATRSRSRCGYKADKGWQSEGWWVAAPGECKSVFNGKLDARYYYIFAADDIGGGVWDGTNFMCTRDETFTIFGVEDCLARGYERTGFFEVDTQSKNNWTLQLTEGEVVSGGDDNQDEAVPLEGDLPTDGSVRPQDQPGPDGATNGTD